MSTPLTAADALRAMVARRQEGEARVCPGCGRPLTNRVSAHYGMGLSCARNIGHPLADVIAAAIEAHQALHISTTKPAQLEQLIEIVEEWVPLVGDSAVATARWAAAQQVAEVHDLPLPSLEEMRSLTDTSEGLSYVHR